ncbi:hypothetical protein EDD16DRAFT_1709361 [Pisolithus croceorrhizus]|nr:hypothetical protein EDD16DRAFT_1709361 [Pisolithus croceorrhizus]
MDQFSCLIAAYLSRGLATPVAPSSVTFWKLNEPQPVSRRVSLNAPLDDIATAILMNGPVAPYISPDEEPVSLVVRLVSPPPRREKHVLEEPNSDAMKLVKRAKIATMSPLSLAQPSTFRALHKNPEEPILDHRRIHNPGDYSHGRYSHHFIDDLPPISLQYEGFGRFLDIFRGCKEVPGMENLSSQELRSAVDELAGMMSLIYKDEGTRMRRGLDALNTIFSARTDGISSGLMAANVNGGSNPDGHFLGPHKAASCVVKFKNESGCGSAIPYVEMTGYFAHSMREAANHLGNASLMSCWICPCLGITITVSPTPGLSCIQASGNGDDRVALYNAFAAASVLLACIREDAAKVVHSPPPPIEEGYRNLPPISSLRHPYSGTHIEFKILDFLQPRVSNRYLYSAETADGKQILVKFTRRYSCELHMFCADRGYAPALLGFEKFPGGFFCVAMDFVQPAVPISRSLYTDKRPTWAGQLRDLVESFHAEGLVHGDLQAPNIICNRNGVKLIDFDWGRKEGEASYPDGPLNTVLTNGRDNADLKITKGDDLRVLDSTLKSLEMSLGSSGYNFVVTWTTVPAKLARRYKEIHINFAVV